MKKKLITALALSVALTFSFTACGSNDTKVENSNSSVNNEISSDTSTGEEQPDEVTENGEADKSNDADIKSDPKDEVTETPSGQQNSGNAASSTQNKPQQSQTPSKPSVSSSGASSASGSTSSSSNSGTSASSSEKKAPTKSDAQAFIGKSASSMIAAIGAPASKSYASSCMGDGEDGELHYSGFTVYTYKEGSSEKVTDVE